MSRYKGSVVVVVFFFFGARATRRALFPAKKTNWLPGHHGKHLRTRSIVIMEKIGITSDHGHVFPTFITRFFQFLSKMIALASKAKIFCTTVICVLIFSRKHKRESLVCRFHKRVSKSLLLRFAKSLSFCKKSFLRAA